MFSWGDGDFFLAEVAPAAINPAGKQEVDPFGLGAGDILGDGDGDGVPLGERRGEGRGNSSASSSSSMGEERSLPRGSIPSGAISSVVDVDESVELEETSRSWGLERGYRGIPE